MSSTAGPSSSSDDGRVGDGDSEAPLLGPPPSSTGARADDEPNGVGGAGRPRRRRSPTTTSESTAASSEEEDCARKYGRSNGGSCAERIRIFALGAVSALLAAFLCSTALRNNARRRRDGGSGGGVLRSVGPSSSDGAPPVEREFKEWKQRLAALRTQRLSNLGQSTCRHPEFFDYDLTEYDLTKGAYTRAWEDANVRSHFDHQKKLSSKEHKRKFEKMKEKLRERKKEEERRKKKKGKRKEKRKDLSNENEPRQDRDITFVHVGKAGGSTLLCNVRKSFNYGKVHCPNYVHGANTPFPYTEQTESALSKQVNCYVHYDERTYCYDLDTSFLVNVRNPIGRLASWYLYEHVDNFDVTVNKVLEPDRPKHCGQLMVFNCYPTLDDLATVGLAGPRPGAGAAGTALRIGTDLTEEECKAWAWAAVRGRVPASFHNVWNYDWYLNYLLEWQSEFEIFVLRVEHLDQDWSTVDKMVGGTGDPLPQSRTHANDASSKPLPVSNKTVSDAGMANLCRALCQEIQVYKRILAAAANLNGDDLAKTMEELRRTCSGEVDIEPRDCG